MRLAQQAGQWVDRGGYLLGLGHVRGHLAHREHIHVKIVGIFLPDLDKKNRIRTASNRRHSLKSTIFLKKIVKIGTYIFAKLNLFSFSKVTKIRKFSVGLQLLLVGSGGGSGHKWSRSEPLLIQKIL